MEHYTTLIIQCLCYVYAGRINTSESIMFYEANTSHSTYQNASFVPMFIPQFSSPADEKTAQAICDNNSQCLLDYAATGNIQLATATNNNSQAITSTSRLFG